MTSLLEQKGAPMNRLNDLRDRLLHIAQTIRSDDLPPWLFRAYVNEVEMHRETFLLAFQNAPVSRRKNEDNFNAYIWEIESDIHHMIGEVPADTRSRELIMRNLTLRIQEVIGLVSVP